MAEHAAASEEELTVTEPAETTAAPAKPTNSDAASADLVASDEGGGQADPVGEAAVKVDDDEVAADEPADDVDGDSDEAPGSKPTRFPLRWAVAVGVLTFVSLAGLGGWFGFGMYKQHQSQQQRELLVQVARQGALNLTTIDWQHADADIKRILDSATGAFYDDFSNRSQPFVDVVKKAQSKSVGTITEAGLESQSGNEAQVLVAVSVKTSNVGAQEQDLRHWRMRISVQQVGNEVKVSNVAFVL